MPKIGAGSGPLPWCSKAYFCFNLMSLVFYLPDSSHIALKPSAFKSQWNWMSGTFKTAHKKANKWLYTHSGMKPIILWTREVTVVGGKWQQILGDRFLGPQDHTAPSAPATDAKSATENLPLVQLLLMAAWPGSALVPTLVIGLHHLDIHICSQLEDNCILI